MKLVLDQGVELHALNHTTVFCTCTRKSSCKHEATRAAEEFGVPITVKNVTEEFLRVIENPRHGYGSNVNPCIDCRILLMRSARELMEEIGARFAVTGEVLGERPMSQRRDTMRLIEREAGLENLVVRPLCAHALDPSIPEREGWADREKFMGITGRRRTPQIELAREFGLNDYPCPAGGCRLTEPGFSWRMRDLLAHEGLSVNDVQLLKVGRHFRLGPRIRAVVGRNEEENEVLLALSREGDSLLELSGVSGPVAVVRGPAGEPDLRRAAAITAHYTKARDVDVVEVTVRSGRGVSPRQIEVQPARREDVEALMIAVQQHAGE
jgi:hypothetical protein